MRDQVSGLMNACSWCIFDRVRLKMIAFACMKEDIGHWGFFGLDQFGLGFDESLQAVSLGEDASLRDWV